MEAVFARQPVHYTTESWSDGGGATSRGLCGRRRQIEEDIEHSVRRRMLDSGVIKDRSMFLERTAESCFFGCNLLDHLAHEISDIAPCQVSELSETLYREQYVVPVMKFVNRMSKTTVLYRYSRDERRVKPKLAQERLSSLELVRYIIEKRTVSPTHIAGNKLLEILDKRARDVTQQGDDVTQQGDDVVTDAGDVKHAAYRQCQRMLVHGFLVPAVFTHNERYQKFRAECSYCLCDTKQKQERIKKEQEKVLTDDAQPDNTTGLSFSNLTNRDVVNISVIPHRSFKRQRTKSVVWTMEFKTQQPAGRDRRDSQRSVASDVEVIENTPDVLSYTPPRPLKKTNSQERLKRGYRKLLGIGNRKSDAWLRRRNTVPEYSVYNRQSTAEEYSVY